jgi:hypothetical protein
MAGFGASITAGSALIAAGVASGPADPPLSFNYQLTYQVSPQSEQVVPAMNPEVVAFLKSDIDKANGRVDALHGSLGDIHKALGVIAGDLTSIKDQMATKAWIAISAVAVISTILGVGLPILFKS